MSIQLTDHPSVFEQANKFSLNAPSGIALLPRNYFDAGEFEELINESATQTVRALFRNLGIDEGQLDNPERRIPSIQENDFSLILPTLFVSALVASENEHLVALAISVITDYAKDFFKGIPGKREVKLSVVVEKEGDKSSKKLTYCGPPDGLDRIPPIIKSMHDE